MRQFIAVEIPEIISYGEKYKNISWNTGCELLRLLNEGQVYEIDDFSEIYNFGFSDKTKEFVLAFCKAHNLTEFIIKKD